MPDGNGNVEINTDPNDIAIYDDQIMRYMESGDSSAYDGLDDYSYSEMSGLMTNMINGIFGIPYQFSEIVDPVVAGTDFGRKYMEKIIADMPILFLSPGEPLFMAGYSKKTVNSMINSFLDGSDEVSTDEITGGDEGRYYTFNPRLETLCEYVDLSAQVLAKFMGIGDEIIQYPSGSRAKLKRFQLNKMMNGSFKRFFGASTSIPFYLDSEDSISESFSNDTTESMIAQPANAISDKARELQFLMGTHGVGMNENNRLYSAIKDATQSVMGAAVNVTDDIPMLGGLVKSLTSELVTVVSGGRIVFPEIWSSSSYSRSYSINMKFRSPDPDPLSIFLNVDLPILILANMTAGRQFGKSANGYGSPFLVRATYKSLFACDLGIISDLSITRGGDGRWNSAGQALSADVSVTIKDLYSTMFMSHSQGGLLNNTAEMDWLALMAGLDMNQPEHLRKLKLQLYITTSEVRNAADTIWSRFKGGLNRKVSSYLSKLGSDMRYW